MSVRHNSSDEKNAKERSETNSPFVRTLTVPLPLTSALLLAMTLPATEMYIKRWFFLMAFNRESLYLTELKQFNADRKGLKLIAATQCSFNK